MNYSGEGYSINISRLSLRYINDGKEVKVPIENGGGIIGVLLSELLQWSDGSYVKPDEKPQIKRHIQKACDQLSIDVEFS